eukprot:3519165-Pyramimonas_sp.AAC.1
MHHRADAAASCEEQLRTMWNDPPEFRVYDPDLRDEREAWLAKQAYRATIELPKTFEWALVDMEHADERAKRIHLAEVDIPCDVITRAQHREVTPRIGR